MLISIGKEEVSMCFDEVPFKRRARFSKKNGKTYTPAKTAQSEKEIRDKWIEAIGKKWAEFEGPVSLEVVINRPLAKSNPKKRIGTCDLSKPDCSNILKSFEDALNGIAYKDDRQIISTRAAKGPRLAYGEQVMAKVMVIYYEEEL